MATAAPRVQVSYGKTRLVLSGAAVVALFWIGHTAVQIHDEVKILMADRPAIQAGLVILSTLDKRLDRVERMLDNTPVSLGE